MHSGENTQNDLQKESGGRRRGDEWEGAPGGGERGGRGEKWETEDTEHVSDLTSRVKTAKERIKGNDKSVGMTWTEAGSNNSGNQHQSIEQPWDINIKWWYSKYKPYVNTTLACDKKVLQKKY